ASLYSVEAPKPASQPESRKILAKQQDRCYGAKVIFANALRVCTYKSIPFRLLCPIAAPQPDQFTFGLSRTLQPQLCGALKQHARNRRVLPPLRRVDAAFGLPLRVCGPASPADVLFSDCFRK